MDFDKCFREEVAIQTGVELTAYRPTRSSEGLPTQAMIISFKQPLDKPFRLFGSSSLARLLDKPQLPQQCTNCWDFHNGRKCRRTQRCKRCGKTGHELASCHAPEQCPNCLEPAPADHRDCPLKPRLARGAVQRPDNRQRKATRTLGAKRYKQRNIAPTTTPTTTTLDANTTRASMEPTTGCQASTPSLSPTPSITVTNPTQEVGREEEEEDMPLSTALLLSPHHSDQPQRKRRRNNSPPLTHEC